MIHDFGILKFLLPKKVGGNHFVFEFLSGTRFLTSEEAGLVNHIRCFLAYIRTCATNSFPSVEKIVYNVRFITSLIIVEAVNGLLARLSGSEQKSDVRLIFSSIVRISGSPVGLYPEC